MHELPATTINPKCHIVGVKIRKLCSRADVLKARSCLVQVDSDLRFLGSGGAGKKQISETVTSSFGVAPQASPRRRPEDGWAVEPANDWRIHELAGLMSAICAYAIRYDNFRCIAEIQ